MPLYSLTDQERFSLVESLTGVLSEMNHSTNTIAGPLASRILGAAFLTLASLADALIHTGACMATPYNFFAYSFYPTYQIGKDFEFSSNLVHLMRAVESISQAFFLPLLCLVSPDKAHSYVNSRNWPFTFPNLRIVEGAQENEVARIEIRREGEPGREGQEQIDRLNRQLQEKDEENGRLNLELAENRNTIATIRRIKEEQEVQIGDLANQNQALNIRLEENRVAINEKTHEHTLLTQTLVQKEEQFRTELVQINQNLRKAALDEEGYLAEIERLKKESQDKENEKQLVNQKCIELDEEKNELLEELNRLKRMNANLTTNNELLTKENTRLNNKG